MIWSSGETGTKKTGSYENLISLVRRVRFQKAGLSNETTDLAFDVQQDYIFISIRLLTRKTVIVLNARGHGSLRHNKPVVKDTCWEHKEGEGRFLMGRSET